MRFLLLINEPRGQRAERDLDEGKRLYAQMQAFGESLQAQGKFIASESLLPDEHGVRVRTDNGKRRLVDGPFTEAREMVGGFFLIEAESHDEAIDIAARCPAAAWATVEVRACAPCYVR